MPAAAAKKKRRNKKRSYIGAACPRCNKPLDFTKISDGRQACSKCGLFFDAVKFTPPTESATIQQVAQTGPDGSVPCANHEKNAAVAECSRCGSFICELCRIDTDDQTYCPACFDRLSEGGELESAVTTFRDYSRMGSSYAAVGLLTVWFSPLLGPLGLYYAIRGLRQKKQFGEYGRIWTSWITIILSIGVTGLGIFLWSMVIGNMR